MRIMQFTFDPWRGGFAFSFAPHGWLNGEWLFGGQFRASRTEDGKIQAFESAWDRGGLPLAGFHRSDTDQLFPRFPGCIYLLDGAGMHGSPDGMLVHYNADFLDFKFFYLWRHEPEMVYVFANSVWCWMRSGKVTRVRFSSSQLAGEGRIEAVKMYVEDFK